MDNPFHYDPIEYRDQVAHIAEHVDFVWPELMYGGPRLSRRSNPPAAPGAHRPRIVQSGALNVSMKRVSRGLR